MKMSKEFNLFDASLSGISLVEAGAGTGKTYNIASLFIRVILELKLMPANILVLTYTEAATAELISRLRNRIKESIFALEGNDVEDEFLNEIKTRFDRSHIELLKKALYQFDEAAISTIHGFCQQLLKEHSVDLDTSSEFEIISDDQTLLQEIVDSYWRGFLKNDSSEFERSVIKFVVNSDYYPDNLMKKVRLILNKPYAVPLPESKPLKSFNKDLIKLKEAFIRARKLFFEEEKEIQKILDSDSLNGLKYKNKERHFEDVKSWFRKSDLQTIPADRLYLFSSFMQGEGKKKGKEIPDLNIFEAVDEYLILANTFSNIEIAWLKDASVQIGIDFEKAKEERNVLTYNDLLTKVEKGILKKTELATYLSKKYPVALIDEFQDTDPIQYSIFRNIYSSRTDTALFMIGDPKQAIYSFRGADIYTYLKARNDASEEQKYSLSNNFRSSKMLIESVNKVFSNVESAFLISDLPFKNAQFPTQNNPDKLLFKKGSQTIEPLQFIELELESNTADGIRESISDQVCKEILHLLSSDFTIENKHIKESDIAVLVRTHYQALEIQNRLRDRNIKSLINSKESVFSTKEASELYLILSSINHPSFEDGIRAALSTEAIGFNSEKIIQLLQNESEWNDVYQKILRLNKLWREKGFIRMSNQLLSEFNIEFNYASYFDAERRITNIHHLLEILSKAERLKHLSSNGIVNYFKNKRSGDTSDSSDDEIVRLESDERLVQIITMHSSKGLEYPIVLCPYLWEGISTDNEQIFSFHNLKQTAIDLGSKDDERIKNREVKLNEYLAERVRLTYVALTRAKVACYVFVVDGKGSELSPFSILMEDKTSIKQRILDKLTLHSNKYKSTHITGNTKLTSLIRTFNNKHSSILYRTPFNNEVSLTKENSHDQKVFKTLPFSRTDLFNYNRITSFSSLSQSGKYDLEFDEKFGFDYDDFNISNTSIINPNVSIHSLPKGAKTGTLLHEIFEEIQFNDRSSFNAVIKSKIIKHSFSDIWVPVLKNLVTQSVEHVLFNKIRLKDLAPKDCLIEMEFHFPANSIELNSLMNIIRDENLENITTSISGYMKGFIDLIFKKDGKYYILDYKSNFLGDNIQDYNQLSITEEIKHSTYDLQYHIYILALHRLLNKTIPNYSYEEHFGGVLYFFLRGIDSSIEESGVYYDKPDYSTIQALNNYVTQ